MLLFSIVAGNYGPELISPKALRGREKIITYICIYIGLVYFPKLRILSV